MPYAGLIALVFAYMLSQFYRAMLAVLATALEQDLGALPADLSQALGLWFLTFAAMQIPVGAALDRIGPRRTTSVLLLVGGGGGAALFAMATAPWHISAAMVLIGIGCSPVLMASYYIFGRTYPAAMFATLGALVLGFGSLGNILSSAPMGWAAETIGWRVTLAGLAAITAFVAIALYILVRDPEPAPQDAQGSVTQLLRQRSLWPIFAMMLVNYMPAAGLRGLWAGPYARDVLGADASQINTLTLVMSVAMIIGSFAYGPLDRLFRTRKWVVLIGNGTGALALIALWLRPEAGYWPAVALFAVVGAACASFAVLIAHGRSFFPPHLMGRGVTLLNLFGIAGVGLGQFVTGRLYERAQGVAGYEAVFGFMALAMIVGLLIYTTSQDRID